VNLPLLPFTPSYLAAYQTFWEFSDIKRMLSYDRSTMGQSNQTPSTADHLPITTTPSKAMANGISHAPNKQPETEHHHIWLVTGPAGCGKSTVAQYIAQSLHLPFLEGDDVSALFLSLFSLFCAIPPINTYSHKSS